MRAPALAACALALLLAAACGRTDPDAEPIATVGGVEVPMGELRAAVESRLQEDPGLDRDEVINDELNRLVLDRVVLNRAAELRIDVPDDEVDARVKRLHGIEIGEPDADYREQVRREMMMGRTVLLELGDRVRVPEGTAVLHFEENREAFAVPERIEVRQIVVADRAEAEALHARLGEGADFAQLAAEHSLAPQAPDGGLLPPFGRGEMPELFDAAFELKVGRISDVIESPYGFHILRVEQRLPAHQPDYAEVRDRIMLELEGERLEDLRREWLRGLRRAADIDVNERLLEALR